MGCGLSNRLSPLFETNGKKNGIQKRAFLLVPGCSSGKKRKTKRGDVYVVERKGVRVLIFSYKMEGQTMSMLAQI